MDNEKGNREIVLLIKSKKKHTRKWFNKIGQIAWLLNSLHFTKIEYLYEGMRLQDHKTGMVNLPVSGSQASL